MTEAFSQDLPQLSRVLGSTLLSKQQCCPIGACLQKPDYGTSVVAVGFECFHCSVPQMYGLWRRWADLRVDRLSCSHPLAQVREAWYICALLQGISTRGEVSQSRCLPATVSALFLAQLEGRCPLCWDALGSRFNELTSLEGITWWRRWGLRADEARWSCLRVVRTTPGAESRELS